MSDGTLLSPGTAGDLISDEDMTGIPRQSALLPQLSASNANYKIERTKIAIGDVDYDSGDATPGNALPVRMLFERQSLEDQTVLMLQAPLNDRRGLSGSRNRTADARGSYTRGTNR